MGEIEGNKVSPFWQQSRHPLGLLVEMQGWALREKGNA